MKHCVAALFITASVGNKILGAALPFLWRAVNISGLEYRSVTGHQNGLHVAIAGIGQAPNRRLAQDMRDGTITSAAFHRDKDPGANNAVRHNRPRCLTLHVQQNALRIFDAFFDTHQEGHSLAAIDEAVIVGKR